jgi:hypothetical protein
VSFLCKTLDIVKEENPNRTILARLDSGFESDEVMKLLECCGLGYVIKMRGTYKEATNTCRGKRTGAPTRPRTRPEPCFDAAARIPGSPARVRQASHQAIIRPLTGPGFKDHTARARSATLAEASRLSLGWRSAGAFRRNGLSWACRTLGRAALPVTESLGPFGSRR